MNAIHRCTPPNDPTVAGREGGEEMFCGRRPPHHARQGVLGVGDEVVACGRCGSALEPKGRKKTRAQSSEEGLVSGCSAAQ